LVCLNVCRSCYCLHCFAPTDSISGAKFSDSAQHHSDRYTHARFRFADSDSAAYVDPFSYIYSDAFAQL
jgi:hypothetical protein